MSIDKDSYFFLSSEVPFTPQDEDITTPEIDLPTRKAVILSTFDVAVAGGNGSTDPNQLSRHTDVLATELESGRMPRND